ncbi:penicillin amidase [Murinocardiopsis flavida]|uniref:Penicillin amidase n=1 Tax=Murinocardiopsis flavida TaxID=645275 RepID=A0A2P8DS35_9ACTN|nr:penicillin acylase family protein [Murinocardiopsis flavida]PSL00026.1 penicillin amidase [Murinocardiopsis flavida]
MAASPVRWKRWGLRVLAALAVVLLIAAALATFTVRQSFPQVNGEIKLPGLDNEATVYRDANGIPQIYADTPGDLFQAQGYVHAQDRFWQMDVNRHTTAGRLAEMFGPGQVDTDAWLRTMGWRRVAEQEYDLLAADTQANLDSYADGVNAYLKGKEGGEVSLEYAVLGLTGSGPGPIEEWTAVDSLAWLKAMAWDLRGNMSDEIDRAGLLSRGLSREQVEELYPDYPEDEHAPIVPGGSVEDGEFVPGSAADGAADAPAPDAGGAATDSGTGGGTKGPGDQGGTADKSDEDGEPDKDDKADRGEQADKHDKGDDARAPLPPRAAGAAVGAVGEGLADLPASLGEASPDLGSNSWVVSGEHTESGGPLLANDPHLGPAIPSVWYQTGLHCTTVDESCPYDVSGYTFPGLPGVVIGRNADVAWGFTNLGPDVTDLYLERIEGDSAVVDGEKEPLETRTETIEVAGEDPVEITVRSTRHGPLMSDAALGGDLRRFGAKANVDGKGAQVDTARDAHYGVSLAWTALEPGRTADAVFRLNRATGYADFRAAARTFEVPAQNLVYADTDGSIAYQAPGRIPVRAKGDGRWPAPGWDSDYDWDGFIPFKELPAVRDPERGYIVTANQAAVGADYPHMLTSDWDYGYRSQRIDDLLADAIADGPVTVADMGRIQMDNANAGARALVPHLLDTPVGDRLGGRVAEARDLLADWDFRQDAGSAPAAFYNATWRHLLPLLFDELGENTSMDGSSRGFLVVAGLLEDPDSPWWDGAEASGPDHVLALAMERAAEELAEEHGGDPADWRWGELHTFTPTHQTLGTSGIGPVEWLFNGDTVPSAGGSSTVNATGWKVDKGYEVDWVPSMRMVLDLGEPADSRWVDLTGASGHAFHPAYGDQTELWQRGATLPMPFGRASVRAAAEDELTLHP